MAAATENRCHSHEITDTNHSEHKNNRYAYTNEINYHSDEPKFDKYKH